MLKLTEVVLTAEVYNQYQRLNINDLTPVCREIFGVTSKSAEVKRPVSVSEGMIRKVFGISDAAEQLKANPFVSYEEFGQRLRITALPGAADWFVKKGGTAQIQRNPALAWYYETERQVDVSYLQAKAANIPYEDTRAYLEKKISAIIADDEKIRGALDLIIVSAPEEVTQRLEDLVLSPEQEDSIRKINTAMANLDFLRAHDIHEVGKFLFVGPPGTGKTSLALSMSHVLHMPILEVRLSMITSQYLGETSKNIDRIFDLARKLTPSILFIDEFDFIAKSRTNDDHGAMKRAVNALLKNIDQVNLVKNGVVLIGATNHPRLLDDAAWRRFDEVIEFALPDTGMRRTILSKLTATLDSSLNLDQLAEETAKFSGADLRMIVKEGMISALMRGQHMISQDDIEKGVEMVEKRNTIKDCCWV
ncbi:ATP-binding protein [Methanosphaerula palustris]|uniref:AAA ATPase central domain protein n=1 Tax=Methanosphaerula palustris (strain ATCC BAA-1556 / DSM 19958 / E1-9c) TaxID=521011 RepID=B8GF47_METPE|nr:ATP-binding protein [Methanosphaerula palustris]ACL17853.1 AAA ATPase central domain protein [Methanosphaerula palustris E1-9c]